MSNCYGRLVSPNQAIIIKRVILSLVPVAQSISDGLGEEPGSRKQLDQQRECLFRSDSVQSSVSN